MRMPTTILLLVSLLLTAGCSTPLFLAGATAGGAAVVHDRRTAGTVVDDQSIELKAVSRLNDDPDLAEAHVNVTSFNGIVLLSGEAPNKGAKARATALVEQLPRVRRVHNELVIGEPSSFGERSRDTWITTKLKTKLLAAEEIEGTRIKVITERRTVYLMGLIEQKAADAAVLEARTTDGVEKVVKLFEYTD